MDNNPGKYEYTIKDIIDEIRKETKNFGDLFSEFIRESTFTIYSPENGTTDITLCNHNFDKLTDEYDNNNILCSNYRAVFLNNEDGSKDYIRIRVSSSSVKVGYKPYDMYPFNYKGDDAEMLQTHGKKINLYEAYFNKYCNKKDEEKIKKYDLSHDKVVYYDTAYPQYNNIFSKILSKIRSVYKEDIDSVD